MLCAIWYHLYNLKNVKNAYGGVMLKVSLHRGCFSLFSSCTNGTKLRKVFHIVCRASDMKGLAEKGIINWVAH